jgi:hypothetical protein
MKKLPEKEIESMDVQDISENGEGAMTPEMSADMPPSGDAEPVGKTLTLSSEQVSPLGALEPGAMLTVVSVNPDGTVIIGLPEAEETQEKPLSELSDKEFYDKEDKMYNS